MEIIISLSCKLDVRAALNRMSSIVQSYVEKSV